MKIYLGADHNGFDMKAEFAKTLAAAGYEIVDEGDTQRAPEDDFPQFAARVVQAMKADASPDAKGILICGSGQGMAMAANRFRGIRASVIWDVAEARAARNDDDSNVLCLPARSLSNAEAVQIAEAWLAAPFAGAARFKRRIAELDQLA